MLPNNFVYDITSLQPLAGNDGPSWCTNVAPYEADPAGITAGLLYQYNSSAGILPLPLVTSPRLKKPLTAKKLTPPRLRSYNL